MNYNFYFDGRPWNRDDLFIGTLFMDEWARPTLGQQIKLKGKILKIVRIDPRDNPTGQSVKYYVESLNPDWPYREKKT